MEKHAVLCAQGAKLDEPIRLRLRPEQRIRPKRLDRRCAKAHANRISPLRQAVADVGGRGQGYQSAEQRRRKPEIELHGQRESRTGQARDSSTKSAWAR